MTAKTPREAAARFLIERFQEELRSGYHATNLDTVFGQDAAAVDDAIEDLFTNPDTGILFGLQLVLDEEETA